MSSEFTRGAAFLDCLDRFHASMMAAAVRERTWVLRR